MGKKITLALIFALLLLPAALIPFSVDAPSNRAGQVQVTSFYENPPGYLTQRLGGTNALLSLRGQMLSLFEETGSEQVLKGREGYLFYRDTLPDFLRENTLVQAEIDALADALKALSDTLNARGARLVVLIAPNKNTIYPEYMPTRYLPSLAKSNLDLVQEALKIRNVAYTDAKAVLSMSKQEGALYFKADTHWNARGAAIIYTHIMQQCGYEALIPKEVAGAIQSNAHVPARAGDLLALYQPAADLTEPDAQPQIARAYTAVRPIRTLNDMTIRTRYPDNTLKMLVMRDSFFERLFPYFANSVGALTLSRVYEDVYALISSEQPDLLIIQIAERNLPSLKTALQNTQKEHGL